MAYFEAKFTAGPTLEFDIPLLVDVQKGESRDLTTINLPATTPEQALVLKYSGKKADGRIQIRLHDNGADRANNTLEDGGVSNKRLALGDIVGVDTTNEIFTVNGDVTGRTSSGDKIAVRNSTGNDGTYTVDSVTYDSNNDETDVTVTGDITDGTADGQFFNGVVTLREQVVWLEEHINAPNIGKELRLKGHYLFEDSNELHLQDINVQDSGEDPETVSVSLAYKKGTGVLI